MTTTEILTGIKDWVFSKLSLKQDVINDLAAIRRGSQAGSTAVQPSDLSSYFNNASYDTNTHRINFYHGQNIVAYVDASPFIVDGMVDDVRIENGYLVIDFNTASGKHDISIPLTDIFDPSNYYNKAQTNTLLGNKVDKVQGKGLSTNDYTNAEKEKLSGLQNYDDTQVRQLIGQKQDIIKDLEDIRSGASAGASAVQPSTLNSALSDTVAESGVYDVTANNNNAKFASLSALLGSENLDTLIPSAKRKGGMSIKFVQSSDNKYVQYRYLLENTASSLFTNDINWQGVENEINRLYPNLPTSKAVFNFFGERMSYADLLFTELKTGNWVDNSNVEHAGTSFNLYYFDDIVEGQTLWLYTANYAAYVLFVDENGNIVGTPYSSGSTHSIWKDIVVPVGAKRLKVSNLNNLTTYPNGLPLRVLAHTNDDAVKEAINNIEEQNGEIQQLSEKVYDITGDIIINNYDNDDLSNLVYSSNKYKVVTGFNTLIVPVNNGYSVKWNYTSTAEDAILSYYIDANEPVLNGTRDVLYNPVAGVPYTNTTGATVWLVVTFKTSTSPTITATVELKKISKHGLDIITNKWIGKKMLCVGDSITDMGLYVDPLTSLLGTITYNRGYSGECLTDGVPGETHSTSGRVDLPASDGTGHHGGFPTEADLVTILTSANDWYHMDDIPLGEVTDAPSKTASFCSAFHYLMQGLKSKYPSARVVVIIPYRIYSTRFVPASEIAFNTANDETSGFTFIKKRTEQITLDDLRDRMIKIASVYGADVIDLREVGFSFFWNYDREAYSYITDSVHDGLHPNIEGGKIMAEYIAKHLISCN